MFEIKQTISFSFMKCYTKGVKVKYKCAILCGCVVNFYLDHKDKL